MIMNYLLVRFDALLRFINTQQFRKASIRASAARAHREREAAEEKTATLAAELAEAGSATKKSRAVTFSKGDVPGKVCHARYTSR